MKLQAIINIIVKLQAIIIQAIITIYCETTSELLYKRLLIFIVKLQAIIIQAIINIYCETTSDYYTSDY